MIEQLFTVQGNQADEIPVGVVCSNLRFVFDHTVTLRPREYLVLRDAQWFRRLGGHEIPVFGRWCPPEINNKIG